MATRELAFTQNPVLFGRDPEPGLVNLQGTTEGVRLYFRTDQGVESREDSWPPFLWLSELSFLEGLEKSRKPPEYEVVELEGDAFYRYLLTAGSQNHLQRISKHIAKTSGLAAGHPRSPQLYISDPTQQYLLWTGKTVFGGMKFEDLERLQVHVSPVGDAEEPIECIGLADGRGWSVRLEGEESQILQDFCQWVRRRDPDVIEGHHLFKRHLPQIHARAKELGVELRLGRDVSKIHYRRSRMAIAEKNLDYSRWYVHGRDAIDSWILLQLHDVSGREFDSYELEDATEHFGFESDDPLVQTARLMETIAYPYFLQAQIFAYRYEHVVMRGNATRIDSLFLREYLRQRRSIPTLSPAEAFAGGYTAQEYSGIAQEVYHCDVASLYPSLILAFDLGPGGDSLGVFTGLLRDLKEFRLQARELQRKESDPFQARFLDGLQQTFKILINSFYGYLGFSQGHFSDFEKAAEVTRRGRQLLKDMMNQLKEHDCRILEVDTDGIYFTAGSRGEKEVAALVELINQSLPTGVEVELDGYYPAMYCHKMKNYALLQQDGQLIFRGSGLRSRALEPLLRDFLQELIGQSLKQGPQGLQRLLDEELLRLEQQEVAVERLCKKDTLVESPRTYLRKVNEGKRNRSAAYELALGMERRVVAGEPLRYYVTGDKANVTVYDHCRLLADYDGPESVNWKYYQKKLKETYKKFAPLLLGS